MPFGGNLFKVVEKSVWRNVDNNRWWSWLAAVAAAYRPEIERKIAVLHAILLNATACTLQMKKTALPHAVRFAQCNRGIMITIT